MWPVHHAFAVIFCAPLYVNTSPRFMPARARTYSPKTSSGPSPTPLWLVVCLRSLLKGWSLAKLLPQSIVSLQAPLLPSSSITFATSIYDKIDPKPLHFTPATPTQHSSKLIKRLRCHQLDFCPRSQKSAARRGQIIPDDVSPNVYFQTTAIFSIRFVVVRLEV